MLSNFAPSRPTGKAGDSQGAPVGFRGSGVFAYRRRKAGACDGDKEHCVILSDATIRAELKAGRIAIEPFDDANVQPSSVDMHVDRYFRVFRNDTTPFIDPKEPQEDLTELVEVGDGRTFILDGDHRLDVVQAGWDGHLTLELSNVATLPIAIYPGMKIGQISFFRMTTPADHPYGSDATGSKYQGQRGPTPSRYYLNFRDRD